MKYFCQVILVFIVSAGTLAEEPLRTPPDREIDVKHIRLELDVSLKQKQVSGSATITIETVQALRTVRFDAVNHEIASVMDATTKNALVFVNTGEQLQIDLGTSVDPGHKQTFVIHYRVREPKAGLYFFGPSAAEPNVPWMMWSQGEPMRNRYWFPCVDNPNDRQSTEIIATVDSGFEALSNGELVARTRRPDGRVVFHWKQQRSHVAYLVSLVVGKFAVTRETWRNKPVLFYVPPDRAGDAERTFGRTTEMLEFFSKRFGVEYPWEKYAQVVVEQFIMGGMENTSATTLTSNAMHDKRAIIDSDAEWLIAHELGHQWFGDLVTCRDWTHLWLNEGFATYCEYLWADHRRGQDSADYLMYRKASAARSKKAKERPIVDRRYKHPWSMFDARAYPKGAWVLHMLRAQMGDDLFFTGLKRYLTEFSYKTAETSDLRRILERHSGRPWERFFYDWTERPGHPELEVASSYDTKEAMMKIAIKQTQNGEAFHFPLRIELMMPSGPAVVINKQITEKELTFYTPLAKRPVAVRIDPNHTLLAEIKEIKSRDWWARQLYIPRVPEQIRAIEHLSEQKTPANRKDIAAVLAGEAYWGVRVEAARALGKLGGNESRDALIDGLRIKKAQIRRACAEALGKFFNDAKALAALRQKIAAEDRSYFVEAAALESFAKVQHQPTIKPLQLALAKESHREVIRQAALKGLAHTENPRALEILLQWTRQGKPLRCRTTALRSIATYLNRAKVTDTVRNRAIDVVMSYLKGDNPRVRRAAVETLRDLGGSAEPATRVLESLAEQDPDDGIRELVKSALDKIRNNTPASVELTKLRTELEELRKERSGFEDRLLKVEGKQP